MFSRPYSRKLEAEADQVGLQLAAKVSLFPVCYYLKEHSTDFTLKVRCICHEEYYTAKKNKQLYNVSCGSERDIQSFKSVLNFSVCFLSAYFCFLHYKQKMWVSNERCY